MDVWLSFYLLVWGGLITVGGKLLDAFSDTIMVLFIFERFLHEITDSWGKSIIIVFTVTVNGDVAMLDGCLIAVKWDFFNIFFDVLYVVARVELKKLNKVFLFEGAND